MIEKSKIIEHINTLACSHYTHKSIRQKYIDIFELIYTRVMSNDDLNAQVSIHTDEFRKITKRHYKEILTCLYNDDIIYFSIGDNNELSHGIDKYTNERGTCRYRLSNFFITQIQEDSLQFMPRKNDIMKIKSSNEKMLDRLHSLIKLYQVSVVENCSKSLNNSLNINSTTETWNTFDSMPCYFSRSQNQYLSNILFIINSILNKYNNNIKPISIQKTWNTFSLLNMVETLKSGKIPGKAIKQIAKVMDNFTDYLDQDVVGNSGKKTDNKNYLDLRYPDGTRVMEELPHYGKYDDGRIYSAFHTKKKSIREQMTMDGSKIVELFDIPHAYPTLLSKIFTEEKEYAEYIQSNDIYTDILEYAGLEDRTELKKHFNKYVNSTKADLSRALKCSYRGNKKEYMNAIVDFMSSRFSTLHEKITNYKCRVETELDTTTFELKRKKVKLLNHELQKAEREVMGRVCNMIKTPYVTLHDAVYVKEEDAFKYSGIDFNAFVFNDDIILAELLATG